MFKVFLLIIFSLPISSYSALKQYSTSKIENLELRTFQDREWFTGFTITDQTTRHSFVVAANNSALVKQVDDCKKLALMVLNFENRWKLTIMQDSTYLRCILEKK